MSYGTLRQNTINNAWTVPNIQRQSLKSRKAGYERRTYYIM